MRTSVRELEELAVDAADGGQAGRLRAEAQTARQIEAAESVAEAFLVLEEAAGQTSPRALRVFAERAGRLYAMSLRRLGVAEKEAVRSTLRTARGTGK